MTVFVTSDLHLGHASLARRRLNSTLDDTITVQDHDQMICEQWIRQVGPKDQVWVLGDLAASSPNSALGYLATLPGEKHLVAGNHDKCHSAYRDSHRVVKKYLDVFASVQMFARKKVLGQSVLLSHFPYEADHTEKPRFMQYRLPDLGELLIHGHLHSPEKYTSPRELHIGLDAWDMKLVPWDEIVAWVQRYQDEHDSGQW